MQIDLAAYADESDISPGGYPFPPDAPVEGAYLNCPDVPCGGDRHVLLVDNATCLLYEGWRRFVCCASGHPRGVEKWFLAVRGLHSVLPLLMS